MFKLPLSQFFLLALQKLVMGVLVVAVVMYESIEETVLVENSDSRSLGMLT
jgi:hypothetical protein